MTPYDVVVGSYTKVWWKCKEGHEWEISVYSRTRKIRAVHTVQDVMLLLITV